MPTSSKKPAKFGIVGRWGRKLKANVESYMSRRPHRSFRLTRRRDYVRELKLPGYLAFTNEVHRTLWRYKKIFIPLGIIYIVLYGILVGAASQETYSALTASVNDASDGILEGAWGVVGQAAVVFASVTMTGLAPSLTDAQQIFALLLLIMVWVTTVWLLRNLLAGHRVRLRDGLYSSGGPLFSTIVMAFILAVQLLPLLLVGVAYAAASTSGLLAGGVEAMLFWIASGLLVVLSAFWATSTLFAMVVITLPGMYPLKALNISGDIVTGRRIRILLRWIWMLFVIAIVWVLVLFPLILFDGWLKSTWEDVSWLPLVPFVMMLLSAWSTIWLSAYVYLMYRKVFDNEVKPR